MSCAAVSPAKTSAQPGKAPESPESEADSGERWQGSFAKFAPATSSWKTHQRSLLGGWELYSETWPRWGSMRDGACWERTMSAHLTSGTGSGSWQTPTVEDAGRNGSSEDWKKWEENRQTSGCRLRNQVQHCPTPRAANPGSRPNGKGGKIVQEEVKIAEGTRKRGELSTDAGGTLNPTWVEWLMGWPLAWTDLKPLGMDKFRQWQLSHGKS